MSDRISEIGLVELETWFNKYLHEDGETETPRVSAKLALQITRELRRLRGLIVAGVGSDATGTTAVALADEARAIREEQDKA